MTPFEAALGWNPKSPIDILKGRNEGPLQSVTDFKKRLEESFRSARFAQRLAQAIQAAYKSKKYQPPTYVVGDNVYLSRSLFY